MRLYLDDIRKMPNDFDIQAWTAETALAMLAMGKVDHISFDHDLGDNSAMTGYDVAKQIEEWAYTGYLPRITWEIHSANPVGRKNIKAAMEAADKYWSAREAMAELGRICYKCASELTDEDTSSKCNTCLAEKCL